MDKLMITETMDQNGTWVPEVREVMRVVNDTSKAVQKIRQRQDYQEGHINDLGEFLKDLRQLIDDYMRRIEVLEPQIVQLDTGTPVHGLRKSATEEWAEDVRKRLGWDEDDGA